MKTVVEGRKITFTFADGQELVTFNADEAQSHAERAMMHGFEQKLRDSAAISRKQKDGTVITVTEAMRRAAVLEMAQHLITSTGWNMRTAATVKQNPTWAAIAAKRGVEYAVVAAEYAQKALDELNAL